MRETRLLPWVLAGATLAAFPAAAQAPLVLTGAMAADGPEFVRVPFEVPAGTVELEVKHEVLDPGNILDWGVESPEGFRGYGGGNPESAVIGVAASSRSYLAGPITPGAWAVYIGKAKVETSPARYRLEFTFRTAATSSPQPERAPYSPAAALKPGPGWYAGDFHVHSRESGDAKPSLDAIASFARGRGLDFVELSEHNTVSQLDFYGDVQPRHPELLLIPGVEFTTYQGHANGIGATRWVDHRLGLDGRTFADAAAELGAQGAVLSINHPVLDLGTNCIGCAWKHPLPREQLGAVELGTGGWDKTGVLFGKQVFAFWERLLAQGLHVAALGGSDDHSGGQGTGLFDSPVGNPTTMVFARELSAAAIVEGVKLGHTVVKLQGPDDPMVDLTCGQARPGDTVAAKVARLAATVTGGQGASFRWVQDGVAGEPWPIDADPFTLTRDVEAPASTETRVRAEVWVDGAPRTVTSHLYVTEPKGCGCSGAGGLFALAALLWPLAGRRRQRPSASRSTSPNSGVHASQV